MIFTRSVPPRRYRNYRRYRSLLRIDFRHRCAYCLTHEHYLGGEAGCTIDHHRPRSGPYARPDLESEYSNLYWSCRECNDSKSDTWPSIEDDAIRLKFLDPCTPEGDHDRKRRDGYLYWPKNKGWWRYLPPGANLGGMIMRGFASRRCVCAGAIVMLMWISCVISAGRQPTNSATKLPMVPSVAAQPNT
jgi:hypothetical protein